jgi:hypothetical protein
VQKARNEMAHYPTQKLPSTVAQYDQIGSRCAPLSSAI